MPDHSRTIQIRIYEEPGSTVTSNKGIVPAWRVRAEDRVWFVRCSNGNGVQKKAVFKKGSPFKSGDTAIQFELLPSEGAPVNEQVVKGGGGSYEFYVESNPTQLLKGQIDIDP